MKGQSHPYLIIFSLWLIVFVSGSQVMIVAPILPRIAEELKVVESLLGSLMVVYAWAVGVLALITGPISDRYGRRRVLLVGTGVMSVALLLHGLADSFGTLLAARGLAGAAGGILSGGAVAYVGDYFPVNRRGWAGGWVMSGLAAGQIAGIPLGNLLADWLGFRAPFLAFAVIAVLAFFLLLFRLPQPLVQLADELSVRSGLRGYGQLLLRKEVRAAAAAFILMFMGLALFVTFFPTWLEKELGFTPVMVSILYVVGGVANVLVGPQAGKLSDRVGRVWLIIGASIGLALAMPIITLVPSSAAWLVFPLFFITMALVASRMSPLQALMTQLTTDQQRGMLMSLVLSTGQIGFGLGSAVAAAAWAGLGFTGNALIAMASVLLMAWVVWKYLANVETTQSVNKGHTMPEVKSDTSVNIPAITRNL